MSNQKLTIKQKKFADEYIKTGNASESYKKAYSTKNMSDDAIRVEGNRTLTKPYVKDYVGKRMKELEDTKIPKQKEILEFLGRVMRGEEKSLVITNKGAIEAPPKTEVA